MRSFGWDETQMRSFGWTFHLGVSNVFGWETGNSGNTDYGMSILIRHDISCSTVKSVLNRDRSRRHTVSFTVDLLCPSRELTTHFFLNTFLSVPSSSTTVPFPFYTWHYKGDRGAMIQYFTRKHTSFIGSLRIYIDSHTVSTLLTDSLNLSYVHSRRLHSRVLSLWAFKLTGTFFGLIFSIWFFKGRRSKRYSLQWLFLPLKLLSPLKPRVHGDGLKYN